MAKPGDFIMPERGANTGPTAFRVNSQLLEIKSVSKFEKDSIFL
jgi:hypothetical protein